MKNKLFILPVLLIMLIFGFVSDAKAVITSEGDIQYKIQKLDTLSQFDFISLINKNELIGYRLENFNMSCRFYVNTVIVARDNLNNILKQIELVRNSSDYSDTEKNMQINRLYQNADSALNDLDMKTLNFLMDIRMSMPTITYDRYNKKFRDYYNNLGLSNNIVE